MQHITRPLPSITQDNEDFWRSTREHAARLQRCNACEKFWYYPGPVCHNCGARNWTWTLLSGVGTIYSYSVLERAKGNPYEEDVPITIVLVRLAEGPVVMSNLFDYEPGELAIDAEVMIDYEDVNDEVTLIVFRPARR
ncbi:Zn-ribbon domain-containing OB-fold protein [Lacisediminihabitans profunda]|uniref:DNA-binding protein n=1 Tax=Lacisediminihabitans profunda TaxID=2594790 RepID=A0A5C8URR9_9MICO|nr:OB-fold domain-containing protein [Lacisediminihabitans profunda]TXN30937.1 hypothetical protein FVP33_04865 [Lacisediminihabitans profunda]